MTKSQKYTILALRLAIGFIFVYSGITKVMNPDFTALGYLNSAKTMSGLYSWFASDSVLPVINIINSWGQLAIGLSLITGFLVRYSAIAGIVMMVMYYIPALQFPYVGKNSFLVDEHVIYILVFVLMIVFSAGRFMGLDILMGEEKKK